MNHKREGRLRQSGVGFIGAALVVPGILVGVPSMSAADGPEGTVEIQMYKHRGCTIPISNGDSFQVLPNLAHRGPGVALGAIDASLWRHSWADSPRFQRPTDTYTWEVFHACHKYVALAVEVCDRAIQPETGVVVPERRPDCVKQLKEEVPHCQAHYRRQESKCDALIPDKSVKDKERRKEAAAKKERERERLAREAERERIALEEERERIALEEERERIALEEERERIARERDREWLARERERERLAMEEERRSTQQQERQGQRLAERPRNRWGVKVWPSGARYEGEWRDGKRTGRGTYSWSSGARYEGEWRDGKQSGRGTFTFPDGDRYAQHWNNGHSTDVHLASPSCVTLESGTVAYLVNRCGVGVDVLWRDEGTCRSRPGIKYPCSWYIGANRKAAAGIVGQMEYVVCKSPGGLGDVAAVYKNDRVYCVTLSSLETLQRKNAQQRMSQLALAKAKAANKEDLAETIVKGAQLIGTLRELFGDDGDNRGRASGNGKRYQSIEVEAPFDRPVQSGGSRASDCSNRRYFQCATGP